MIAKAICTHCARIWSTGFDWEGAIFTFLSTVCMYKESAERFMYSLGGDIHSLFFYNVCNALKSLGFSLLTAGSNGSESFLRNLVFLRLRFGLFINMGNLLLTWEELLFRVTNTPQL